VTSRMPTISESMANAHSDETVSQPVGLSAHDEAIVADLTAQIAELSKRVAYGLRRLDALRSTDRLD
jgi:hypothetical protein